jgi:protein ImuB
MAVIHTDGNGRQTIVSACARAWACHVRPRMTLAEARVMCPNLLHAPHRPAQDLAALQALARWMMTQFTPAVAVERESGLLLEVGGSARLFGGIAAIVTQLGRALRQWGIYASLAVAPTPGAAWALAFASSDDRRARVIDEAGLWPALDRLSPLSLRIKPEVAVALSHVGVETIGQLRKLPRESLPSRFGSQLLLRLDQAAGVVPEPLVSSNGHDPILMTREWDGPVEAQDALALVLEQLLDEAIVELARRAQGARKIELTFRCPYAAPVLQTVALSRATRERRNLLGLLRCVLESVQAPEGFIAICLEVSRAERIRDTQASLVEQAKESSGVAVDGLLERLRIRLGEASLERVQVVESHLPERAVRYLGVDAAPTPACTTQKPRRKPIAVALPFEAASHPAVPDERFTSAAQRPLQLLNRPAFIGVVVSPTHDREGRPVQFVHESQTHRIVVSAGPERVSGIWWTGHHRTRDYFDVTDETGRRFWIFRVLETWKWYLHGFFA